jgi:pimeloyl-ACP methyl ester carboxylesterase
MTNNHEHHDHWRFGPVWEGDDRDGVVRAWDNHGEAIVGIHINVPVGVTIFPGEIYRAARSWAERYMKHIFYWSEAEKGGHFAAFEQPEIFTRELRNCFRQIRSSAAAR